MKLSRPRQPVENRGGAGQGGVRQGDEDATADGDVSDGEEERVKKAQEAHSLAEGLVGQYASKLRSRRRDAEARWLGEAAGLVLRPRRIRLRGDQWKQRMFVATQEIEKHTKKTGSC